MYTPLLIIMVIIIINIYSTIVNIGQEIDSNYLGFQNETLMSRGDFTHGITKHFTEFKFSSLFAKLVGVHCIIIGKIKHNCVASPCYLSRRRVVHVRMYEYT